METTMTNSNSTTEQSQSQKRGGLGRRRIEIAKIQDKTSLIVTFSKRRTSLFKKAGEVCNLCGAEAAVITFSPSGKPYAFGKPSPDSVVDRYLSESISAASTCRDLVAAAEEEEEETEEEQSREEFWWEQSVEEVDLEELGDYRTALEGLKNNLVLRIEEMKMRRSIARNFFE